MTPQQRCWPRRGEPWKPAEDKKLLRLEKRLRGRRLRHIAIGRALGRTPSAVVTRLAILRVCQCKQRKPT